MVSSSQSTLAQALDAAARTWPDKPFLRAGEEAVTFGQLDRVSDRVASGLLAYGIRPGDRVAVAGPNQPEWLYLFFAAAKIGAPVVTLNVRYRERELDHMLNQSAARLLLTPKAAGDFDFAAFYESFRHRVPSLDHVVFLDGPGFPGSSSFDDLAGDVDRDGLAAAASSTNGADPAVILYTSGTTGAPKGATLTHDSIRAAAAAQAAHLGTDDTDSYLGTMPFNHVGGITCTITAALLCGAEVALMPAFTPDDALRIIDRHRVTVAAGVPTMYALMLPRADAYDLTSVRYAVVGGSNADPALCERIAATFPNARLSNLYGLSETSGACVLSRADDELATVSRTLGVPIGGFQVRVVGPDGQPVPRGEDGELQVRGECVCAGYWRLPDETAATFLPGGWLATGDVVAHEPDGHLVLRGRTKEMYLRGGYNVYPVEVENVLTGHPGVAMAAGIGVPDPVLGEKGRYYVVPRPGADRPAPDDLRRYCGDRLADYKVPDQVVIVDELPLTPSGKVAKTVLKDRAETWY